MEDRKCSESEEEALLSENGETMRKKAVPSSMTVNVPSRKEFDDSERVKTRKMPKALLAVLISMGALLAVGIVVVGVLLITQPGARETVGPAPSASQTAAPTPTMTAEPTPSPAKTPMPTTEPEASDDDLSAIFETPTNPLLE